MQQRRIPPAIAIGAGSLAVLCAATTSTLAVIDHASIHAIDQANDLEIVMPLTFAGVGAVTAGA